jgi:hypothetical protein
LVTRKSSLGDFVTLHLIGLLLFPPSEFELLAVMSSGLLDFNFVNLFTRFLTLEVGTGDLAAGSKFMFPNLVQQIFFL